MFIRRLYYGTQTGETLYSYVMSGDIVILSADDVAAGLGLTDYGHMEWLEPDPAIEDSFCPQLRAGKRGCHAGAACAGV